MNFTTERYIVILVAGTGNWSAPHTCRTTSGEAAVEDALGTHLGRQHEWTDAFVVCSDNPSQTERFTLSAPTEWTVTKR